MFNLMKPKPHAILGIDISTSSVKIIELSAHADGTFCIDGYGANELPENAIERAIVKDIGAVADTIKRIVSMYHLTAKVAVISVPDSSTISKIIQISEGLSDSDIEELVFMEADKYIPYPIDEVNIDFSVLGTSSKNAALQDLLIVASRAEIVNSRVEAVRLAGMDVKVVDVDSYVVERAAQLLKTTFPANGANKVIAIIDVGAIYSHLYVLQNMKVIYSRDEEFGGNQLIEAIIQQYGMTREAAIEALETKSLPDDFNSAVLLPYLDKFLLQVKRALQFFYSTSQYSFVDHIVVTGGIAKHPEIEQLLEKQIKISTSIGNVLSEMMFASQQLKERLLPEAPSLLMATGLAIRHIE